MVRDNRHDAAYLFAAICPTRGVGAAMITPAAKYRMHEPASEGDQRPGACAALICDGRHQRGGGLRQPDTIVMITLPPYAPALNPMENVRAYLRANKLCALVWDSYDAILEACRDAWTFLVNDPDRIRSIGSRDWPTVNA